GFRHPTSQKGRASVRILVVDPNCDAADILALLLRLWGDEAEVAYDGPGALEQARRFGPSVVFSELVLPRLNGYRLAEALRAELREVNLIALTGMGREQDVRRAAEAGYTRFIIKPTDPEHLHELLGAMPAEA